MNKFKNSLLGFAIGDAFGVPVEFVSRDTLQAKPITNMEGYGTHYQPEGTWSDDTSMTLATVDSMIEIGGINYSNIMDKFLKWYENADYTATDNVFDIGRTCSSALYNYKSKKETPLNCGLKTFSDNGNGSLMRMLPIAFYCFYNNYSDEDTLALVREISSLTHAHEISILGCYIYVKYILFLLNGKDKLASLNMIKLVDYSMFSKETTNVYNRILNGNLKKIKLKEIKSSGYIVDTLEAALWITVNTDNFAQSIIGAVNLGDDTDTVGAITGGITGIIYGYENIPTVWLNKLKKITYIEDLAERFDKIFNSSNSK